MAQRSRDILKTYYETGDYPTELQFADFIDSTFNLVDDGSTDVSVKITDNDTTAGVLNDKLVEGGAIGLSLLNPTENEQLQLYFSGSLDEDVQVSISDYSWSFIGQNVTGSTNAVHIAGTSEVLITDVLGTGRTKSISDDYTGSSRLFEFNHDETGEPGVNDQWLMTWNQTGILLGEVLGTSFLGIRYSTEPNTYSDGTLLSKKWFDDQIAAPFTFGSQTHGGNSLETFSASKTFDADDGNNQKMLVTASTTIGITNELPGTFIFILEIDTATPPTITIGASFGTVLDNSADLITEDNDINILTLVVDSSGTKYYTINTLTA